MAVSFLSLSSKEQPTFHEEIYIPIDLDWNSHIHDSLNYTGKHLYQNTNLVSTFTGAFTSLQGHKFCLGETERESWFKAFFEMIRFKIDLQIKNPQFFIY